MLDIPSIVAVRPTETTVPPPSFSERIVEAAATILDGGGHADYTVSTIMEVAKVGVSTLYSRFPGKKDAVTEALMHREMTVVITWASLNCERVDGETELRCVVEAMVERALERPAMTRMLNLEWYRMRAREPGKPDHIALWVQQCFGWGSEAERARVERATSEIVALVRSVIDAACADGERDAAALSDRLVRTMMCHIQHFASYGDVPTGS